MKPERHRVRQPRTPRRRTERGRSREQERISPQRGDTRAKLAVPLESVYDGGTVRIGVNNETLDVRIPKGAAGAGDPPGRAR